MINGVSFIETEPKRETEPGERHLVFTGGIDGKDRSYILLPIDYINDGRAIEGKKTWYRVSWPGSAGAIYKVFLSEDEKSISYSKKNIPIGFWKNQDERLEWQTIQRSKEDAEKKARQASEDIIKLKIEPIREAYLKCRNRQERTILLSRIIDYITHG